MTSSEQSDGKEVTLELDFVPSWAKKEPGFNPYANKDWSEKKGPRRPRQQGRPQRSHQGGGRKPHDKNRRPPRSSDPRHERNKSGSRPPRPVPLEAEVFFVPEKRHIGAVAREVRNRKQAFPLSGLASLFLSSADHYLVKLVGRKVDGKTLEFHQCKSCKLIFKDREALKSHIVSAHLEDYFTAEHIETEPPSGNFVCVGKCPKTGTLIGPPNYHGFNVQLQDLHSQHYSNMSLQECRSRIKMVHDPELVEKWRESCSKKTVYYAKRDVNKESPLDSQQAHEMMENKYLSKLMLVKDRVMVPAAVIPDLNDESIMFTVRRAWNRESRNHFTLSIALRPALRHMGLHFFKAKKGETYVTAVTPSPLDPKHTVALIQHIIAYLEKNPGVKRQSVIDELEPGKEASHKDIQDLMQSLSWLIEKGHVLEFFDGTLSLPRRSGRRKE